MKLALKIFFSTYFIVMLSVGAGGYWLANSAASSIIASHTQKVLTTNEYAAKIFLSSGQNSTPDKLRKNQIQNIVANMVNSDMSDKTKICRLSATALYSDGSFVNGLKNSEQGYRHINYKGAEYLQVICRVDIGEYPYYVQTLSDIKSVNSQEQYIMNIYRWSSLSVSFVSGILLLIFSLCLAKPFKNVTDAAKEIANGNYKNRINRSKPLLETAELETLCSAFNSMADAVECNDTKLRDEIKKRETFIGDFTHEMKTPMTSIIGYSDLLRSYNLDEEEKAKAANAIFREAKRLEDLSMKLLDIIVINNDKMHLQPVKAKRIEESIGDSLRFLAEKYNMKLCISFDDGEFLAEPSLLSSLIYNLCDNAFKASKEDGCVKIKGEKTSGKYRISVEDNGKGIDPKNLSKITEPFFMEDKSRSRKQGGAGLGLALCKRIAEIHSSKLEFYSLPGVGTKVSFTLTVTGGNKND